MEKKGFGKVSITACITVSVLITLAFYVGAVYMVSQEGHYDTDGNALTGDMYDIFTTGEVFTEPTITGTIPADGATGIATTAGTFSINFSEPMDTTSTAFLTDLPGAVGAWNETGTTFNITYAALDNSTSYFVDLARQGHQNSAGDALTGDVYGTLTTADVFTGPTIAETIPADGETGVPTTNGIFSIRFSERMDTASTALLTDLPDAVGTWDETGTWFTITYTALDDSTSYFVDLTDQYTLVDAYAGTVFVFILSMIVSISVVPPLINKLTDKKKRTR